VSFAPVTNVSAQVTGTVAVFRDYTHEAEVDRMKSDFVSVVSHELRTPLTSIKGYLDLVLMGAAGQINKQQSSFLAIAKNNADRLNELVADLLDISRIESGRIELDVQVISIPEIVERVAQSLEREFEDRGLTLTLALEPGLPEVFGDPGRVAQILTNLLSNAYKYTPQGGATVRARVARDTLQVDVVDTGVGISASDREKIFTRFFRAEDTAVREQPGTGLGLNITRSIVEMHGGEIWVDSEPSIGTTFSFTLPIPAGFMAGEPAGAAERVAAGLEPASEVEPLEMIPSGPWILVVDDDDDVAHLFEHQLHKAGYRVTVVTQGSRVLEVTRQLQPELITLDLMMDVDGLEILRVLKSDPATAAIPVVIVSVIAEPKKGLALGAADYLIKPLREGELLQSVRWVLEQYGSDSRNKILVVDDEIDIVGWLKHFLTHYGYHVSEAYDGVQALEAVAADRPDLILLDLKMPRMDGRTTLRRLRENEETRSIPVIVLSAIPYSDETERVEMLGLGVREFLRKPVTMEQVVAEIKKSLGDGHE
jgi:DNA-binding response OmpR family regulator/two-component sensor histidine kinase